MYKNMFIQGCLLVSLAIAVQAAEDEIIMEPIPLEQGYNDTDQYPPALEPYPGENVRIEGGAKTSVSSSSQQQTTGLEGSISLDQMPSKSTHVASSSMGESRVGGRASSSGTYNFPATRSELEDAARVCEKELTDLWQQQSELPPYRRPHFQKSIGAAKERCEQLKNMVEVMKKADEQLYTFQKNMDQARSTFQ